jgi:hypothetical protein
VKDPDAYARDVRYGALAWKLRAVDDLLTAVRSDPRAPPAFAYRFDWDEEGRAFGLVDLTALLGAAHGFEIPFVFGHFDLGPQTGLVFTRRNAPGRQALADAMGAYWAQFARAGAPGRGDGTQPRWPPWDDGAASAPVSAAPAGGPATVSGADRDDPVVLRLDTPADGGIAPFRERLTLGRLARRIATDPGLRDQRARCTAFARAFAFGGHPEFEATWETLGDGGCSAWQPEALAGLPGDR